MIEHPALQDTTPAASASPEAVATAIAILEGEVGVDEAIALTAAHLLLAEPRVDVVAVALTRLAPEDTEEWSRLGGRAWVREWSRPGSTSTTLPPAGAGAGPEAALSMPWISQRARSGVVALVDRELMPDQARTDLAELTRVGVRSLVGSALISRGEMFGSMSAASGDAGPWSDVLIQDFRLLNAAIVSRLTLAQSRTSLAEAIKAGAEAQQGFQRFFGAVGHELRTPLSSVLGHTEVLLDDAAHGPADLVSSGVLRAGPVIVRACEEVLGVVDSLLGAGRALSSDEQRLPLVIAEAVADVVHWHRAPANSAGVKMHVDVDPEAIVWAHPASVRQVLANLLGNAITHHHPEGGSVHISTAPLRGESAQEMVRIIVRDDGPGLSEEQVRQAFEPFVRFASPGTKGSGLGLSISRTLADRDGGAVRAESAPGTGSSFWLELPVGRFGS